MASSGCTRMSSRFGSTRSSPASWNSSSGRALEEDRDLRVARRQPLSGPHVEGHVGPAPVLDLELHGRVGLGLRVGRDLRLGAVGRHPLSVDDPLAVLAAHRALDDVLGSHLPDGVEHLHLLVAHRLGGERRRRLHGHQGEELEDVVLDHVPDHPCAVVVVAPPLHAQLLGHGDLDAVHVAPVPDGLEDAVGEPEHQQVLDGLLPEVVVDPVDLALAHGLGELAVQRHRRLQVVPERLLDDDAAPAVPVLARQAGGPQAAHDGAELVRRRGQVEDGVSGRPVDLGGVGQRCGHPLVRGRDPRSPPSRSGCAPGSRPRPRPPPAWWRTLAGPGWRTRGSPRCRATSAPPPRWRRSWAGARWHAGCRETAAACAW